MKVLQDLKYGLRVLRKSPGFSIVAVLVLGLGIGANTAIFSVVNAVLLRPLPFPEADRLVHVWHTPPQKAFPGITRFSVSTANFIDWQQQNHVFDGMAIFSRAQVNLTAGDKPEFVGATTVSTSFFSVLGEKPILGRTFVEGEDQIGHDHEVVLAHDFWQSRFGGDRGIVGRQIAINNEPYTVIGVMGPGMSYPSRNPKLWLPLAWTPKERVNRGEHHSIVVARLKPGVDIKKAQAEMTAISERLAQQYPEDDKDWGAKVVSLREDLVGDVRPALLVLLGAVAFVLLIACANVANLLLARALARSREIAVRSALGASRAQLVQQLLIETVVLAVFGGLLGLLIGKLGTGLIAKFIAQQLSQPMQVALDGTVLVFTFAVSVLAGLIAGLAPAWKLSKTNVNETLKQGGRSGDTGGNRTRAALVVCEVALSLMLLAGAGLMVRSLWNLRGASPGFDASNLLTMSLPVPQNRYKSAEEEINFWNQALTRIRALPGVQEVGAADDLPLQGGSHQPIAIEGRPAQALSEQPEVDVRIISPGYLPAMRIPVVRGRNFNDSDTLGRQNVILISQAMAKRFWPNEDPIGKRLTLSFFPGVVREIVGVTGDVKLDGLDQTEANSALYTPMAQLAMPEHADWRSFGLNLVVRTSAEPEAATAAVTNTIRQLDSQLAITDVMSMDHLIEESISPQRLNMLLLATFAGLALVLAAMGIYSVLSYAVRRRVREIGIRMALGAQISDVLRLVIYEGMKPAVVGLVIGVAGALALGRVLAKLVFGVKTTDPATFAAVSAILAAVAFCATVVPAWRATRVDPMRTLRDE
ncbi:MAG TPA: ABC transporter permease [Candidatus Angelobacter sp.]|jgi:putative ABC transport system permease protein|nr:ABC transporter permease [Candidatus Angelobacter sp.]